MMKFDTRYGPVTRLHLLAGCSLAFGLAGCAGVGCSIRLAQPEFGATDVPLVAVDNYQFKDLNKDGKLEPYEDWRLSPEERARDLVGRLTLEEKAGLMVHASAPVPGNTTGLTAGKVYDLEYAGKLIRGKHINTFLSGLDTDAQGMAEQNNALQKFAENTRLGIPVSVSTDPRHHFQFGWGTSASNFGNSQWPETLGFAALGDTSVTRTFGDIARQEYRAVGITQALSPQADLATEPRWARINGTFSEDAELTKAQVQAYVEGFQGGNAGITPKSVVAVVKHWAGYGAAKGGWDSHDYYGRFMTFPGNNFAYHLKPFEGAFASNVGSVMSAYSMPDGVVTVHGITLEQNAASFNKPLLTDLLRGKYGFKGVIVSDWLVTNDCDTYCANGYTKEVRPDPQRARWGTPWGMESASKLERYAKAVDAGIDQIGGPQEPEYIVQAVQQRLLSEERLNQSAYRILLQKFQQGLFEQPFVDALKAKEVVGKAEFAAASLNVQRRAMVLLKNDKQVLPLQAAGKKVWLYKIDASVASKYGFTVVDKPEQADLAMLRVSTPYKITHPNHRFGGRSHQGSLSFEDGNPDFEAIKAAAVVPQRIVTVYMDRPPVLTNVQDKATAILANFGVSDVALLDVITGKGKPEGKLPFELPSSMEEVLSQQSDKAYDTAHPLYRFGFGLSY